jgi:hypothetical protein
MVWLSSPFPTASKRDNPPQKAPQSKRFAERGRSVVQVVPMSRQCATQNSDGALPGAPSRAYWYWRFS